MSQRVSGLSQEDHRALWTNFVRSTFRRTNRKVSFNGKRRNVYEGTLQAVSCDPVYLVLDEYHGDLEVLDKKATHLGSMELNISADRVVSLGTYHPGGKHEYEWE